MLPTFHDCLHTKQYAHQRGGDMRRICPRIERTGEVFQRTFSRQNEKDIETAIVETIPDQTFTGEQIIVIPQVL
jgi:hypothetical protein